MNVTFQLKLLMLLRSSLQHSVKLMQIVHSPNFMIKMMPMVVYTEVIELATMELRLDKEHSSQPVRQLLVYDAGI